MHALSKALFFTAGAVGLLVLAFMGAVIEFNALSLENFTQVLVEFRFMGYSVSEILGLGKPDTVADHLLRLKVGLGAYIGLGSFCLIITSFLPSQRIQIKFLSFAISIPLIALLFSFWFRFIHDDNTVTREDKLSLFTVTLFTYPGAVCILWYGLHIKRKSLNEGRGEGYADDPLSPRIRSEIQPPITKIEQENSEKVVLSEGQPPSNTEENLAGKDKGVPPRPEDVDENLLTTVGEDDTTDQENLPVGANEAMDVDLSQESDPLEESSMGEEEEASPNLNSITQDEEATTPSSTPVEYNKENEITDDLNPIGEPEEVGAVVEETDEGAELVIKK